MNKIKAVCVVMFLALLTGCANNVWTKAGAGQNEFSQARYNCLQQSQQGASSAYVNRYGGAASSGVVTNDGLFSACMNAAGWSLQDQKSVQPAQQLQQAQFADGQARINQIGAAMKGLCSNPEFQPYFAKSPCSSNDFVLSSMSDKSKITNAEKVALEAAVSAYDKLNLEANDILRKGGAADKVYVRYMEQTVIPASTKNRLDVYEGKITWGDYNKRRQEINRALESERKRIYNK